MYQFSDLQEVHFDVVMISTLIREMVISLQPYTSLRSKRFQSNSAKVGAGAKRKWKGEEEGRRGNAASGSFTPLPLPLHSFFCSRSTRAEPLATQASHIPLLYLYSFLLEGQSISKRQGPVLKGLKNDMEVVLKLKLLPFRRHLFCFVFV